MKSETLGSILKCCKNVHKSACEMAQLVQFYSVPLLTFKFLLKVVEMKHEVLSKVFLVFEIGLSVAIRGCIGSLNKTFHLLGRRGNGPTGKPAFITAQTNPSGFQ